MLRLPAFAAVLTLALLPLTATAETARFAVAANFAPTAEKLAADYAKASGDTIEVISGATGKLYAQIKEGAPFDAFLSADQKTVDKLVTDGLADGQSRFTYARGRLALWTAQAGADLSDPKAALMVAAHVAIANPDLAPYGKAAVETIEKLGLPADLDGRLVMGENIGQAQTMVASGAAELGFVAASARAGKSDGTVWMVPEAMHRPLMQDAVLLSAGKDNSAAVGYLTFIQTPAAKAIIDASGYGAP